jgi:hypothetical protein
VKLFAKGNRVSHADYGNGTITSSEEKYTIIEFDNHGRKVFLTDMVQLAKSDEPAPDKPAKAKRKAAAKTDAAGKPVAAGKTAAAKDTAKTKS